MANAQEVSFSTLRRPHEIKRLHVAYVSSKIVYTRTSTNDQTTVLQLAALKKAGYTKIFFEDKAYQHDHSIFLAK